MSGNGDASSGITLAFEAYGVRIGVELPAEGMRQAAAERFPPTWTAIDARRLDRLYRIVRGTGDDPDCTAQFEVYIDGSPVGSWGSLDGAMEELESSIQIFVAEFATPHLFVHAGVVAWNGRAVVLPGSSFAGKSTLVTALVRAGADYYSDEYAVFDGQGRVLPYRRRISLREGPLGPAGRLDPGHKAGPGNTGEEAIPVGVVLLTRYKSASTWECEPVAGGSAILAMCEHTVAIQRRPADTFTILGKVVDSAPVYRGRRGDLATVVSFLLNLW